MRNISPYEAALLKAAGRVVIRRIVQPAWEVLNTSDRVELEGVYEYAEASEEEAKSIRPAAPPPSKIDRTKPLRMRKRYFAPVKLHHKESPNVKEVSVEEFLNEFTELAKDRLATTYVHQLRSSFYSMVRVESESPTMGVVEIKQKKLPSLVRTWVQYVEEKSPSSRQDMLQVYKLRALYRFMLTHAPQYSLPETKMVYPHTHRTNKI
jgi:hypothetical protein